MRYSDGYSWYEPEQAPHWCDFIAHLHAYLPTSKAKFQGQGALGKTTPITTPFN